VGESYTYAGADIAPDGRYRYRLWREWRSLDAAYRSAAGAPNTPPACLSG
jgi:hypothetical protein